MSLLSFETRNYDFQTIYNFRDFGGYSGLGGRAVKAGRLFRSAHLAALSEEDLLAIGDLAIDLVVDLRHAPERAKQPSRFPTPAPHVHEYPDAPEAKKAKVAPHEAFLEHELYTAEDAHGYMMGSYTARPHDAGFQKIFADTLRFMANAETSETAGVLVHCAAGKDRTGTLCALIQSVLGVSREDIMADYMMTLEAVDIDQIIGPAAEMFTKRFGRPIDAQAIWPMFGVVPEFLNAALDGMLDDSGGVETYVKDKVCLSEAEINRIRNRYLED
ncbi:MAG: tyrosine-protein phosphatase [Litorimonas sp.]